MNNPQQAGGYSSEIFIKGVNCVPRKWKKADAAEARTKQTRGFM